MEIEEYVEFIRKKHNNQNRIQGTPYYLHPVEVSKILKQKGYKVAETINVLNILDGEGLKPKNVSRLDREGERCVNVLKRKITKSAVEKYC